MKTLRFPRAFDKLTLTELEKLPVRVVNCHSGFLSERTFESLDAAATQCDGFRGYMGPFADKIDGSLCIRFESKDACARLSE